MTLLQSGTPVALLSVVSRRGVDPALLAGLSQDVLTLQTIKNKGEASGRFFFTLAPRQVAPGKTWLDLLNGMDYIEIRLGFRAPGVVPGVVLRGFIDSVTDQFSLDATGRPQRVIAVNGEDMGKGLLTKKLWVPPVLIDPRRFVSASSFLATFFTLNLLNTSFTAGALPSQFLSQVVQPLYDMAQIAAAAPEDLPLDLQALPSMRFVSQLPDDGRYSCFPLSSPPQSTTALWDILQLYESPPFSEMFVRDEPSGPVFYWRLPPLYGLNGAFLPDAGALPPTLPSDAEAAALAARTLGWSLAKSEAEALNYFATWPSNIAGQAASSQANTLTGATNPILDEAGVRRFGFRDLQSAVAFVPISYLTLQSTVDASFASAAQTCATLNLWAAQAFGANDQLLSGTIQTVGTAAYLVGDYLRLLRDPGTARSLIVPNGQGRGLRCYIEGVQQDYQSGQQAAWTTTFTVSRGMEVSA